MIKGVWTWSTAIVLAGSLITGCASDGSNGMTGSSGVMAMHGGVCAITPTAGSRCSGVVEFANVDGGVLVEAEIRGLTPGAKHGFHIHEFAFGGSDNAKCTGGHYDPTGSGHHAWPGTSEAHHAGDMGSLVADGQGVARYRAVISGISLTGVNAIVGRAVIVHALPDDGGQPTGNAGGRIGVGTIGIAPQGEHR